MPLRARELTAIEVKRLPEGFHAVGGAVGLYLQVVRGGRSWIWRAMISGRRRDMGLGSFPEVSLSAARQKAQHLRGQLQMGIDPIAQRAAAQAEEQQARQRSLTLIEAIDLFTPIKQAELSAGKYADQWRDSLDRYVVPVLGQRPVADIELKDIKAVLEPIWATKSVTADKLRRKLREIFDYCSVMGHRHADNPAQWEGKLAMVLPAAASVARSENYPALQLKDVARFWRALQQRDGVGAAALRFQMLTATRVGAVRFMTWDEVDLHHKIWTVQPGRQSSKIGAREKAKRVPLSAAMVEILVAQRDNGTALVFPNREDKPLSDATLAKLMREIHATEMRRGREGFIDAQSGEIAVPHGTRSAFKVWASEHTQYDWNLSEAALWHRLGNKVEQAYARTDMLEKRRELMEDWAGFVAG